MPRIGQQRDRIDPQAAYHLNHHKQQVQANAPVQSLSKTVLRANRMMMVMVVMMVVMMM